MGKGFRNFSVSKVKTLSLSTSVCFAHFLFENSEEAIPKAMKARHKMILECPCINFKKST